jgi:hypothetical protein
VYNLSKKGGEKLMYLKYFEIFSLVEVALLKKDKKTIAFQKKVYNFAHSNKG